MHHLERLLYVTFTAACKIHMISIVFAFLLCWEASYAQSNSASSHFLPSSSASQAPPLTPHLLVTNLSQTSNPTIAIYGDRAYVGLLMNRYLIVSVVITPGALELQTPTVVTNTTGDFAVYSPAMTALSGSLLYVPDPNTGTLWSVDLSLPHPSSVLITPGLGHDWEGSVVSS